MYSVNFGALKSIPIKSILLPDKASVAAKFIEINDLPSPPKVEVTNINLLDLDLLGNIKSKFVLINLKASEVLERCSLSIIELLLSCDIGMSPKKGMDNKFSISFLPCTFVSSKSFK